MAQKIILKCDACEKVFELAVGAVKSTPETVTREDIEQQDGKRAYLFVDEIFEHRCEGRVSLQSIMFQD
jgi:hypothetical protein